MLDTGCLEIKYREVSISKTLKFRYY